MGRLTADLRDFFLRTTRHPLSFAGANLTTLSGVLLVVLLLLSALGAPTNPYLGAVTFLVLPAIFVLGLILIPLGAWLYRRRQARAEAGAPLFPVYDLNQPSTRTRLLLLAILTMVNMTIVGVASYKGIEYMDSVHFCGATCHPVMEPEYTAYQGSPHSRVRCVDCHIGPGASWFVQSKLSGTRQVFKQIAGTWPRPVETPITSLRPSRDTCEQCHWPEKFHGDRLVVRAHFASDSANTALQTVLLLKVGGGVAGVGRAATEIGDGPIETSRGRGIHWHVQTALFYRSDEKREVIPWVRVEPSSGDAVEYVAEGGVPDSIAARPARRMDCVDCHNRPTHIYRMPDRALNEALADGRLPRDLPYLKREALAALTAEYPSREEARQGIAARLTQFYSSAGPELGGSAARSIAVVQEIWARNVFPRMRVGWGTYPDHIGHIDFTGCFRCHDDGHQAPEGGVISQDCSTCHSLLAMEEEAPEVLNTLFPEGQ